MTQPLHPTPGQIPGTEIPHSDTSSPATAASKPWYCFKWGWFDFIFPLCQIVKHTKLQKKYWKSDVTFLPSSYVIYETFEQKLEKTEINISLFPIHFYFHWRQLNNLLSNGLCAGHSHLLIDIFSNPQMEETSGFKVGPEMLTWNIYLSFGIVGFWSKQILGKNRYRKIYKVTKKRFQRCTPKGNLGCELCQPF